MKENDFLVCKFDGDVTQYVAKITNVYSDSFDCAFVHSGSKYNFSKSVWKVNTSGGKFHAGTLLTQHDIFTLCVDCDFTLNSFVGITFKDSRQFLALMVNAGDPDYKIFFLHSGGFYTIGKDHTILASSDGKYPVGDKIAGIDTYKKENVIPAAAPASPVNLDEIDKQVSGDIQLIFSDASKDSDTSSENISKIIEAAKIDNNSNPELDSVSRSNLKSWATTYFNNSMSRFIEAIKEVKDGIEDEIKREEDLREFWLEVAFGFVIPNVLVKGISKGLSKIISDAKLIEDIAKNGEILISEAIKYPDIKKAFTESKDDTGLGYLDLLKSAIQKYQDYFVMTFNLKNNRELATLVAQFYGIEDTEYALAIKKIVTDYKNQVWIIGRRYGTIDISTYFLRLRKDPYSGVNDFWLIILKKDTQIIIGQDGPQQPIETYYEHAYVTERYKALALKAANITKDADLQQIKVEYISQFVSQIPEGAVKYYGVTWL